MKVSFLTPEGTTKTGTLTTDHAASNYGMSVVVLDDGTALGPDELPLGDRTLKVESDETAGLLLLAARRAGFIIPIGPAGERSTS